MRFDFFYFCRLKPLDIAFMKELHNLVNIIPVIAKSDTLTQSEVRTLKTRVKAYPLLILVLNDVLPLSLSFRYCKKYLIMALGFIMVRSMRKTILRKSKS